MILISIDQHGKIQGTHSVVYPNEAQLQIQEGHAIIELTSELYIEAGGVNSDKYWVPNGQDVEPRPKLHPVDVVSLLADDEDTLLIEDIPEGTTYYMRRGVANQDQEVTFGVIDDGSFSYSSASVETVQIELVPPSSSPYQRQTLKITTHD